MTKEILTYDKNGFYLNGEKFFLVSGDIHYFRIYPTEWHRHFKLAKDFGLTAIQTYVPWNLHEPEKGKFDFSGRLDICAFLDMATEYGLKVLLRPAPFICSECEFGGLPPWLLFEDDLEIRSRDKKYLKHVAEYYDTFIEKIRPYLSTNGGPIIMVAIENEYGGAGYDSVYMQAIADMLKERGVDVPLYTTDNSPAMLNIGGLPGVLKGSNFRGYENEGNRFADYTEKAFPDIPFFVGELWAGRAIYWGEPYHKRDPKLAVAAFKESLNRGFVNFYMFSGGTNFGFFSGAIIGKSFTPRPDTPARFIAHTTSYDEDAPVSEGGIPSEKYYLCREALDEFLGKEVRKDRTLPFEYKVQTPKIKLTECARLFDNLDNLTVAEAEVPNVRTMEYLKQQRGFTMYSTDIETWETAESYKLTLVGVKDRAVVFDNENFIGEVLRGRKEASLDVDMKGRSPHIDILVEDIARLNTTKEIDNDRKGIERYVMFDAAKLYGWKMRSLPMEDISKVEYKKAESFEFKENDPIFYKGTFDAEEGVDTYLDMRGWERGFALVNGFNLGRFWGVGPQYTLFVPGGLLKDKDNVIEIFEVSPKEKKEEVGTLTEAIMEGD